MRKDIKFSNFITRFILVILICISGYLFIVSTFSTVYVSEFENIYYTKDNILINLLLLLLFIAIFAIFKEKINNLISGNENKMVIFNSILLSAILIYFILSTRLYPLYDQAHILNVVKNMWTFNYSDFLPGGYIDKYDIQKGITLYFYLLSKICGKISLSAIQLLNCIYVVISNIIIYKIFSLVFDTKKASVIHFVLCLYIPQWFYTSFVYGTIPSYFFGLLSIYFFIKLVLEKNTTKQKIVLSIISGVSMSISIVLKTNSVIYLLAIILISIYYIIFEKDKAKYVIVICSMLLFYFVSSKMVNSYYTAKTGMDLQGGIPRTGHMAMGLMDNSDKGPGWYNGFSVELYEKNEFNKEKTNEEAVESIKESINNFKSNKASFISFVSRKIVSQWSEPTFESLYILYGRDSISNTPAWIKNIFNPTSNSNKALREYFNIFQFVIYFGALSYFVLNFKKIKISDLVLAIIVLGGFLFHIMWEAKSQYIIVYFLILIPYGVTGLISVVNKVTDIIKISKENTQTFKKIKANILNSGCIYFIIVLFVIIITSVIPYNSIFGKLLKPSWKTEEYYNVTDKEYNNYQVAGILDEEYQKSLIVPKVKEWKSKCFICLSENENLVLSSERDSGKIGFTDSSTVGTEGNILLFNNSEDKTIIRFRSSQKVADVPNGSISEGNTLQEWDYNGDNGQCFSFVAVNTGDYIIKNNDLAFGVDENGNIILTKQENAVKVRIK